MTFTGVHGRCNYHEVWWCDFSQECSRTFQLTWHSPSLCKWAGKNSVSLCPVAWLEQLPSGSKLETTCLHWLSAKAAASQLQSQDFINCTNTSDVHREKVITV